MEVFSSSAQMPVAKTPQQEEYWRLPREKIMVSYNFHEILHDVHKTFFFFF